ncbi:MAG: ribonuclease HII, partial [Chloroflexota bacterium]
MRYELALWRAGISRVAGVDEVGRGALAGPLVAAAVVLPPFCEASWLAELRDSKLLRAAQRETLDRV